MKLEQNPQNGAKLKDGITKLLKIVAKSSKKRENGSKFLNKKSKFARN